MPPDDRRTPAPWSPPPGPQPWTPPPQPPSPPQAQPHPYPPPHHLPQRGNPPRGGGVLPWVVGAAVLGVLVLLVGAAVIVVRLASDDGDDPSVAAPPATTATTATTAAPATTAAATGETVPPRLPERPETSTPPALPELATRPVTEEGTLRSGTTGAATAVTFVNTRKDAVTVHWLDFDGKRVRYQQMPHDTSYTQQTYASHAWLVCGYDETPLLIVVAAAEPGLVTIR
ncbi:hypothetical protein [Dactylosporangium sp. NPDC050588]|uniref:VHL beta domain-containing protein n=1 Tax=Dactylosporangium sp. NPDC050588 TaxID=3157211 RepID=UPI0033FBC1D1